MNNKITVFFIIATAILSSCTSTNRQNLRGGKAIALYKHDPSNSYSLSHNNVSAICEDKTGIVWLGTIGGGLNSWNKQTNTFTHYRDNSSKEGCIGSDSISAILEDREGNLWIGGGKNSSYLQRPL